MNNGADLHIHSVYSDGELKIPEILTKLQDCGVVACSITDHDTVLGTVEALEIKGRYNLEVVSGIELSTHYGGNEYHILGYFFNTNNDRLLAHIDDYRKARYERAEKILQKLHMLGIDIEMDFLQEIAGLSPITRPHIARALMKLGKVSDIKEAFEKYLMDGAPAYCAKKPFPIETAINMIHEAGGIASIAHPGKIVTKAALEKIIACGLDGIEVIHPSHGLKLRKYYKNVAKKYSLQQTGGLDFHGTRGYDANYLGKFTVPYSFYEKLSEYSKKHLEK